MRYCTHLPSTWIVGGSKEQNTLRVSTLSIDDFVRQKGITRVDYIKVDIEGSELRALHDAENRYALCIQTGNLTIPQRR